MPCIFEVGLQKCKSTSSQFPTLVRPEVFFWRTQAGAEVDLLIRNGSQLLPIEIKLGSSIDQYGYAGLRQCMIDLGLKRGWVVNTAEERRMLAPGIERCLGQRS